MFVVCLICLYSAALFSLFLILFHPTKEKKMETAEEKTKELDDNLITFIKDIDKEIESLEKRRKSLAHALGVRKCPHCKTYNLHYSKIGWCCAFC